MSKEEILRCNKLIVEFMGAEVVEHPRKTVFKFNGGNVINLVSLKFHSDWNELMKVVEKIESLEYNDIHYEFQIYGGCSVYVMSNNGEEVVCVDNEESKILCLYKAIIKFIIMYNEWKTI